MLIFINNMFILYIYIYTHHISVNFSNQLNGFETVFYNQFTIPPQPRTCPTLLTQITSVFLHNISIMNNFIKVTPH